MSKLKNMSVTGTLAYLAIAFSGCAPASEQEPGSGTQIAGLVSDGNLWPNGEVPICVDVGVGTRVPNSSEIAEVKTELKRALQTGWQRHAGLHFKFLPPEMCRELRPDAPRVRVFLKPVADILAGGVSFGLGFPGRGAREVDISFCLQSFASVCSTQTFTHPSGVTESRFVDWTEHFRAVVQHEIGHAIGIRHEQDHPDTPADVRMRCPAPLAGRIHFKGTPTYDRFSLMGYCRDIDGTGNPLPLWRVMDDRLSDGDREGIAILYGPPRTVPTGSDGFLYRVTDRPHVYWVANGQACHVTWPQFVEMGKPFVNLVSPQDGALVTDQFTGNICTKKELGTLADGIYRPVNGQSVFRLQGEEACMFPSDDPFTVCPRRSPS